MKHCKECREAKSWDSFSKRKNSPDGHEHICKPCRNTQNKEATKKRWGSYAARNCFRNYGITIEERDTMLEKQGGCAVCGREITFGHTGVDGAVVDHCHTEGHVRGVLCTGCNKMLGLVYDDVQILANAIKYLELEK